MKKLRLLLAFCALLIGWSNAWAETDYTDRMSATWTNQTGGFQGGSERYQNSTNVAGKIMYQSFTAPATGIYEIKFYAVTSSTAERDAGVEKIYGPNIAQAYATAGENKAVVGMNVIAQTGCTLVQDANIRTLSVEATEGETIEYGLENIAKGGNWYTIKALSAKMKTVAEIFQAQYDEAYAIWENSTENEVGARATFKTYVDALNTAMSGTLAEAQTASDNLAAQLVIYESKSYPVKGSGVKYDFTSKMNMAINAWTCVQGNGPAQYGFTGATETYGNTSAGKVMYQTLTGLANGEYEIHFYAVANAANGGGVEGTKTTVYANDQELEVDVIKQSSCTPSDYEREFTVMVTDGSIEYGFKNTVAAGNWYICKNVALYMTGAPDLSDYYDAIAAKLVTANGLKSSPMKSTVLNDLTDAIAATEGYTDITVIGTLETLSADLTTAINNANISIGNYEEASSILNAASNLDAAGQAYYAANENVAAIQSAYNERTLEAVTNEQKAACIAVLPAATRQQTSDNADWTAVIVNPSFETGNTTGWTYETSTDHGAKLNSNPTYTMTNCDGNYLFNIWPSGNVISQEIDDLPNGVYKLSAYIATDAEHQVQINGNSQNVKIDAVDKETGVQGEVTFTVIDNTATIGAEGVDKYWYKVDDFRLTYVRAATVADYKEVLNGAITSANGARKIANEGTGVFQIPADAGTTLASAISAAQGVYDNAGATISDVAAAINTLKAAVATYEATTLNAPDADKHYNIIVATEGHAKNGNAIVESLGATSSGNPTGYSFNASATPNVNLAQAVKFTQVSGNTYNISFETSEGVVYLTYGSLNGSAAGWATQQIQGTTDSSKKGEFKIAATATANVFNIYNTITKSTIACQAGGSLYTEAGNADFTIAEASQATVAINIPAAQQYATRIFPFTPTLPTGVVAYSCASADGDVLNLGDPVATPAANTPYILYAENGYTGDALTGWGTAPSTDAKKVGLLTGVYANTSAPLGSYVLQNNSKVGFYHVVAEKQPTVGAYRCYLTDGENTARAAFFFRGDITGVDNVEAASEATLKDGKYLENGKIVIVKNGVKYNAAGAKLY